MSVFNAAKRHFVRRSALTCLAVLTGTLAPTAASAHHRHHHRHVAARVRHMMVRSEPAWSPSARPRIVRVVHGGGFTPPFSAYAVDGNSGRVLYGQDENALRHPASITKVMTLYLLFGEIERGRLSLDTRIEISRHAAAQKPTKLGLRPGSTIRIEDAIKAIVTKSANDMAVAIAERIGGSEPAFAAMMTRKAHALGMSRSNFVNASGLPDDMQITTARDLATLGRAIHDRYPQYFHYFSTPSFTYAGQFMANHNHLMEQVEGMDGIKTGYTHDSGFNLLSSVKRNGHWLVSVVLGGKTRLGRDRIMANLIATEIDKCATRRTTPMVAENPDLEHVAEAIPVVTHEGDAAPPVEGIDDEEALERPALSKPLPRTVVAQADEPDASAVPQVQAAVEAPVADAPAPVGEPAPVAEAVPEPTRTRRAATVETIPVVAEPRARVQTAFVSNIPVPPGRDMLSTGSIRPRGAHDDGSTSRYEGASTTTPSHGRRRERAEAAKPIKVASLDNDLPQPTGRPAAAHKGWMIQIGAPDDVGKANDLLSRARSEGRGTLSRARPFTEKVQKGRATLYRARFAGLEADSAQDACRALKRAGMSCFATRD